MAQIKGITLKAVKHFNTLDGGGVSGNIYMDNKKIGEFFDEGFGGGLTLHIALEKKKEFEGRVKAYFAENPSDFEDNEFFIEELLELLNDEKEHKRYAKQGYPLYVKLHFVKRKNENKNWDYKLPKAFSCTNMQAVEQIIEREKPVFYKVYSKPEDFVIQ